MATQRKRFQVQFDVSGDGKVSAAFVDVEQGARKAGAAVERGGKQADEAAKRHDRLMKAAQSAGKILGGALAAGLVASATAGAVWSRQLADQARDIERFSRLANTTPEVFQRWTAAASTVGIEQEKLADILKDMQDRVGDFMQTGAGPMADFFENIAPKVGVTAQQFARLSGPEALQLYVDSLQRANLHQNDLSFYMEALASDSTLLLPLLQGNGHALRELGDEADRAGSIIDEDLLAASLEVDNKMRVWHQTLTGLKLELMEGLIPEINNLMDTLNDPQVRDGLASLAQLIANVSAEMVKGLGLMTSYISNWRTMRQLGTGELSRSDASYDDLNQRLGRVGGALQNIESGRSVGAGILMPGENTVTPAARKRVVDRLMAERDALMDEIKARLRAEQASEVADPLGLGNVAAAGLSYAPEEWMRQLRPEAFASDEDKAARAAAEDEGKRAADALDRAYEGLNSRLHEQIELFGQVGEAARIRYEIEHGGLQELEPARQRALVEQAEWLDWLEEVAVVEGVWADAAQERTDRWIEGLQEQANELSIFSEQAGRNIQGHLADGLFDPFDDGLENMVENFARALARMGAELAASQMLNAAGEWGTANAGAGGWQGVLGGMLGGLFGGGRAVGGPTRAGGIYRVNEHEPELLQSGGQTYLLMGGQDGTVVPPRAAGGSGGGPQVNVTVHEAPPGTQVGTRPNASGGVDVEILVGQIEGHLASRYAGGEGPLHQAVKSRHNLRDSN